MTITVAETLAEAAKALARARQEAAEALARARQEAAEALARARQEAFEALARKLDDVLEGLECFDGHVPLVLIEALAVNMVEALGPASEPLATATAEALASALVEALGPASDPLGDALKNLNKADSHLLEELRIKRTGSARA